jgi:hypothetical protein
MKYLVILALVGCGTNVQINQATAVAVTNHEKSTAAKVEGFAKSTPPAGAQSMGMMSSPHAGNTTIPIANVEVFQFSANIDDNAGEDTFYWAVDGDTVYVWGQIGLVCVDDAGNPDGETGTADFVLSATGEKYGWMTATSSCGYTTFFGCSNATGADVCGGCDFNATFIECATISS